MQQLGKATALTRIIIMKLLLLSVLCICFVSCTISLANISTEGSASDVLDEQQTATPTTTLTVPVLK